MRFTRVCQLGLILVLGTLCLQRAALAIFLNPTYYNPLMSNDPTWTRHGAYVRLENGHVLFARYNPPSSPDLPTVVLMNGLPDTLDNWRQKEPLLIKRGYGVLAFDFRGQGNSLVHHMANFGDLSWQAQVEDVRQLMDFFGVKRGVVSGLSYGGGIALAFGSVHPERTLKVIAFAPFVEPVQPTENQLRAQTDQYLRLFPGADAERVFADLFRFIVYTSYPFAEPSILAHPLKPEAITQLALGIRSFDAHSAISKLPKNSLTLVGGVYDSSVPLDVLMRLWEATPQQVRQSMIYVDTGHRITTWRSELSAHIVNDAITNFVLRNGHIYQTTSSLEDRYKVFQQSKPLKAPKCSPIFM